MIMRRVEEKENIYVYEINIYVFEFRADLYRAMEEWVDGIFQYFRNYNH